MGKQKDIGTRFESGCVRYLRAATGDMRIRRSALAGAHDEGDIHGLYCHGMAGIAECKSVKSIGPALLRRFQDETETERGNADAEWAALIVHVPGCDASGTKPSFARNSVYMTIRDLARVDLYLMEAARTTKPFQMHDEIWIRLSMGDFVRLITCDTEEVI
ncbi:MAG: hypothetical protein SOV20_08920 [Coriobacteriales bacterium]|nr:hypothetical protein [Coriobacteriaceae bacterium]MDY2723920.1 hypothetical protein [Coriobacteriales bacterium]